MSDTASDLGLEVCRETVAPTEPGPVLKLSRVIHTDTDTDTLLLTHMKASIQNLSYKFLFTPYSTWVIHSIWKFEH